MSSVFKIISKRAMKSIKFRKITSIKGQNRYITSIAINNNKYIPKISKNNGMNNNYNNNNSTPNTINGSNNLGLTLDAMSIGKSTVNTMRRFTTITNNQEDTINGDDVELWEEPFGRGASGRVFKGIYLPMCQIMAVKVTSRLDNDNVKQILGEYKQQQKYLPECPQLLRIYGWYRDLQKNEVVIALEYMDLGSIYDSCFQKNIDNDFNSLKQQEKSGHKQRFITKLKYEQVRYIARQVLIGLHYLHTNEQPLIHRDIKPHNILLSSFGEVKIADFGLLYHLNNINDRCKEQKGTSKYFSPERINGEYSFGCDIWALGITLIEISKQELLSTDDLDWFSIVDNGIDVDELMDETTPIEFKNFVKLCCTHNEFQRPNAKQLLQHPCMTRLWGDAFKPNLTIKPPQFVKMEGDHKALDKILNWLQEWILFDENNNAKLFENGDNEYLKQCVYNLSRATGLPSKYIDTYIPELYRSYINANE
mmetsp:Transcript_106187/g.129503  ORF Transcript_106187/g.129503 Transcript_106187/m.129503 type:complete len:479 (+) Transcript_106187:1209-2645(+)